MTCPKKLKPLKEIDPGAAEAIRFLDAQDVLREIVSHIKSRHTERSAMCGSGGAVYGSTTGPRQYLGVSYPCGSSCDCQHCWGERLQETIDRGWHTMLFGPQEQVDPVEDGIRFTRDEAAGATETGDRYVRFLQPGESWDSLQKWIARHHDRAGRLRLTLDDGRKLVICKGGFPGARKVSVIEAATEFIKAVPKMSKKRNAFRFGGEWQVKEKEKSDKWEKLTAPTDPAIVKEIAERNGLKSEVCTGTSGRAVLMRFPEGKKAPAKSIRKFEAELAAAARLPRRRRPACPRSATQKDSVHTRTSSLPPAPWETADTGPPRQSEPIAA